MVKHPKFILNRGLHSNQIYLKYIVKLYTDNMTGLLMFPLFKKNIKK